MEPLTGPNTTFWPITAGGERVGEVTSAVWSPRLAQNIALAMVRIDAADVGTALTSRDIQGTWAQPKAAGVSTVVGEAVLALSRPTKKSPSAATIPALLSSRPKDCVVRAHHRTRNEADVEDCPR